MKYNQFGNFGRTTVLDGHQRVKKKRYEHNVTKHTADSSSDARSHPGQLLLI